MSTLFEKAAATIDAAYGAADLFADQDPQEAYRELAKICHPDCVEPRLRPRAERVFKRLGELYAQVSGAASRDSSMGDWSVLAPLHKGAVADLYTGSKASAAGILKIAREEGDNGLLGQEAAALRKLASDKTSDTFKVFIPGLLDTFEASERRVNVLSLASGCIPLPEIVSALGGRVPFRHVVWMMNRLLSVLGWAHRGGLVHGAILPHHLLYLPEEHGLVLVDWTCSVPFPSGGHIPLLVSRWSAHYPVEVRKKDAYPATDIFMAAKAMEFAAGSIPKRFQGLFEWCLAESPSARPQDAWAFQDKWRAQAVSEYGKPKFVKLEIPVH